MRAFDRLRRRLSEDLGTVPGPTARAAHEVLVRTGHPRAGAVRRSPAQPGPTVVPRDLLTSTDDRPLAGRARELDALEQQVATPGALMLVEGGQGMGKSRLVSG